MESIEKLREWLNYKCIRYDSVNNAIELANGHHPDELYEIADEIEREVSERYMPLPVDADGVPWHIGEEIELPHGNRDKVRFMTIRELDVLVNERGWVADQCRHVNPRTIEDVLAEFRFDANLIYGNPNIGGEERADELATLDSKYADELRSMGVCDD